ncbi:transcriptional regulator IclR family [Candidatus Colimorpha enterica]|uniref:Transcriptional regulator IclR family n=1 Tax=Candidatus Colimorpha enterica TaxID=3083063 RepID=R6TII6_9BACT|nr:transcriptional regulator IclR family [Candidatus Colimorpha enterica]
MNNSAKRVLDILGLIASSETPLTASEIGKELSIPKSSVFDIVNILSERGYITTVSPYGKAYRIGISAYRTGMAFVRRDGLFNSAHPILRNLSDATGETCYLAVEADGKIVYLDKAESSAPIRSSLNVGSQNGMHCTGLGKALLAAYPEERAISAIGKNPERHTENTLCDLPSIMAELEKTRERGYAIDNGEDNTFLRCVAAPVRDADGNAVAAISVTMLESNFRREHVTDVVRKLTEAALAISHINGYIGNNLY